MRLRDSYDRISAFSQMMPYLLSKELKFRDCLLIAVFACVM